MPSRQLIEAERFGYSGDAFTGARREGTTDRLRETDGGTLFLDEIGDIPLSLQSCLLRVLQERVAGQTPTPHPENLHCHAHQTIRKTVDAVHGNIAEAARRLGISRNTPYRKRRCPQHRSRTKHDKRLAALANGRYDALSPLSDAMPVSRPVGQCAPTACKRARSGSRSESRGTQRPAKP